MWVKPCKVTTLSPGVSGGIDKIDAFTVKRFLVKKNLWLVNYLLFNVWAKKNYVGQNNEVVLKWDTRVLRNEL